MDIEFCVLNYHPIFCLILYHEPFEESTNGIQQNNVY